MPAPAERVIVTGNAAKPRVRETIESALPILRGHVDVVAVELDETASLATVRADLAFVFGGDGAILRAARMLGDNPVPVCGIKLGTLGFLATLTDDALAASLPAVLGGEYTITSAMTLACRVGRAGSTVCAARAVNDAVVSRGSLSRLIGIDLLIDGENVTSYNADGIIVSTPLGSTAHGLAAGGPIIEPGVDTMILTPICPHTLSNRPLAVSADRQVELHVGAGPEGVAVTIDGQLFEPLERGDVVSITRSEHRFRLVRAHGYNYFLTLRDKLGWSGHLRG